MKKTLLLFFCILSTSLFAQDLQWARTLGGNGTDKPQLIKLDSEGNVYVSGIFVNSIQFSDTDIVLEAINGPDIYLYKRNPSGDLLWAKVLGGYGEELLYDIAIDADDNLLIVGDFHENMILGSGANSVSLISAGHRDGFVAKYSSNGDVVSAYALGGENNDDITTIGFDNDNNILLAGRCGADTDFDFSSNIEMVEGNNPLFLLKLSPEFEFISVFKGSGSNILIEKIITTEQGDYILAGSFTNNIRFSGTFPNNGLDTPYDGTSTGFIMKLSADGDFIWGSKIQGDTYQNIIDIALTADGSIILTGEFIGTSNFFDMESAQLAVSTDDSRDVFFAKISDTGVYEWLKIIGGTGVDEVAGIALRSDGNIILAGSYTETMDFDPSLGSAEVTAEGFSSSYISRYSANGDYLGVNIFQNTTYNHATGIVLNQSNEMYLSGWFTSDIDFSPSQPGFDFESVGGIDTYLLKMNGNTVGLNEQITTEKFLLFPNPANTEIHIKATDIAQIEVFDVRGKLMLKKRTKQSSTSESLNVSQLSPGIYFIRLTANDGTTETEKLVIAR